MIHVMQENGEVVCAVGSALWSENATVFQDADIAIAMDTLPTTEDRVHPDGQVFSAKLPSMRMPKMPRTSSKPARNIRIAVPSQRHLLCLQS